MSAAVTLGPVSLGGGAPLFLIAGPCVIESEQHTFLLACEIDRVARRYGIPFIFKASYDKANRTSLTSYRGPGLDQGLSILKKVREQLGVPVLTDVHSLEQVAAAAEAVDVLQIPAFLCRQSDLIAAAARTGKVLNIKKGQFLAPWDVRHVVAKAVAEGNEKILVTERGTTFGYQNLVVDMRSLPILRGLGRPVVFDATHSVQLPGGGDGVSAGQSQFIRPLARAAVAAGVDGLFVEVHEQPEAALSDGPNALRLDLLPTFLEEVLAIDAAVRSVTSSAPVQ